MSARDMSAARELDAELFTADHAPAVDPVAAELAAAFGARAPFAIEGPRAGCWTIRYVGEYTSLNTERDALRNAAEAVRALGYEATLWCDERGPFVRVTRGRWFAQEEPHDGDCGCDDCEPEGCDPAERFAGQSDRRVA